MTDFQPELVQTMEKPTGKPTSAERYLAKLLADVVAYLARSGMTESRFGRTVANNTELLPRLRRGQASVDTLIKVSRYLRDHRK